MAVTLSPDERAIAAGGRGDGAAMAMRIVAETARLMGADRLLTIESAHIDGALYRIVGVTEPAFTGLKLGFPASLFIPLANFDKMDANKDGTVTQQEVAAARRN